MSTKKITLDDLKRGNPNLYAECVAIGVQQERRRLLAAMPPGPGPTAWQRYTYSAIKNGTPMNESAKAQHLSHALATAQRKADSETVACLVLGRLGAN